MKPKFTPGPWQKTKTTIYGKAVVGGITSWVASTNRDLVNLSEDQELEEANAALIADCPTLLKVLEKCFRTLQGEYPKDQWEEYYPDILEAKALLEKHLGDLGLED